LFVGITRAMRQLSLTHVAERMLHGKTNQPMPSPFLGELPADVLDWQDLVGPSLAPERPAWSRWAAGPSGGWRKRRPDEEDIDAGRSKLDAPSRDFSREDVKALRQAEQESTEQRTGWPLGTLVRHPKFGIGKIVKVTPSGPYTKATIDFRTGGLKAVILEMAKVERLLG
jgi:DNA helicase-2/ATP-dependent DNA helicase PcrA